MADQVVVRMGHLRALGYCAKGVRAWCERFDMDYRQLLSEGLPAAQIEAIGDDLGNRAAQLARQEANEGVLNGRQ